MCIRDSYNILPLQSAVRAFDLGFLVCNQPLIHSGKQPVLPAFFPLKSKRFIGCLLYTSLPFRAGYGCVSCKSFVAGRPVRDNRIHLVVCRSHLAAGDQQVVPARIPGAGINNYIRIIFHCQCGRDLCKTAVCTDKQH